MLAFSSDALRTVTSSSSSSSASPSSSSSPGALSPEAPLSLPPFSLRISRFSSPSCRSKTVSRSSSSVRFVIFELSSSESFCTCTNFWSSRCTSCSLVETSSASSASWHSGTESSEKPAATMSASAEAEAGQRLLAPPKNDLKRVPGPPPSCGVARISSDTASCTPATRAWTSGESSAARGSSRSSIVATRKGAVCVRRCTLNLCRPSTVSPTEATSWSPAFEVTFVCEATLHNVPTV
mmetsp:Transcript_24203/g.64768  ORF Transcript_24203/g.64768 Transcript_24203/m.64768 type:complete len:238 (+) Transcript_24203:1493-2206(+)